MKLEEFKKEVYDLAKFNASLTKGYGRVWKSADYDGYVYKNKKLKELVDVAKINNYPVFYDGRVNVIYFIFDGIQISFHSGNGIHNNESFGLPSTNVIWDGIKNAHLYSVDEYMKLKKERLVEIEKRKKLLKETEVKLEKYIELYLTELNNKLKRTRNDKSRCIIENEIENINKMGMYKKIEYFRFIYRNNADFMELSGNLYNMKKDDFIHNYTVG